MQGCSQHLSHVYAVHLLGLPLLHLAVSLLFSLPPIFQLGVHEEELGTRLTQAHNQDITAGTSIWHISKVVCQTDHIYSCAFLL